MASHVRFLVVVRRGEAEVFESLQEHFALGPDPTPVIWDRRIRDRRVIIRDAAPDRRHGERRAPIEAKLWTERGFVVVRVDRATVEAAPARQSRAPRGHRRPGGPLG
jgi:site-specific recombinase XerC